MTPFEWLALAYFGFIAVAAARRAPARAWLYLGAAVTLVILARFTASWEVRAWAPHVYLVLGYWIPAAFTPGVHGWFERWLERTDAWLMDRLRLPAARQSERRQLGLVALEAAYLLCYPLVPAAFLVVFLLGGREDIVRFWVAVLAAGYACYGTLPWTAARPPRLLHPHGSANLASPRRPTGAIARLNAQVLKLVSHNLTTFPSGHVAVSIAAALACRPLSAPWGTAFLLLAVAISTAAVAGGYHYLVDVLLGVGIGILAWVIAVATTA